jgi:alpha-D-ribose 1-methylphosphonate 5-triphosphate diphosphatase PhnM
MRVSYTLETAKAAHISGLLTVVGAPNILLGGSHSGNMSATEAILQGCADIVCSDYYPRLSFTVFSSCTKIMAFLSVTW